MRPHLGPWPLLFLYFCQAYALADPSVAHDLDPINPLLKRDAQVPDIKKATKIDPLEPKLPRLTPATASPTIASATSTASPSAKKAGTQDAPVDGHDGKPHQGPFVDSKEPSEKPAGKGKIKPEDGVMNDPNRAAPKKGTTGTEGGVSEKSKEKAAADEYEDEFGQRFKQVPTPPKDSDAVSHTEEDQLAAKAGKGKAGDKTSKPEKQAASKEGSKPTTGDKIESKERPKGAMSLEKPEDLPEKPHDIPHPAPQSSEKSADKDRISTSKSSTTDDSLVSSPKSPSKFSTSKGDSEDEYDDEDGAHDFVRWDSFIGSLTSIAATEIGDKTFIVAALMAMRHPRFQVFTAAFSALFIMTILSGLTGHAVGAIISKRWAAVVAAALFLFFGAKSLKEGYEMDPHQGVAEEMREVQAELEEKEVDMRRANSHQRLSPLSPDVLESGRVERSRSRSRMSIAKRNLSASRSPSPFRTPPTFQDRVAGIKNLLSLLLSPAWVETFSMTFIGELGDRSQIATVAMAAGQEYFWVMVGATLGHFLCTACAVIGGSILAGRVSMRKGMFSQPSIKVKVLTHSVYSHHQWRCHFRRLWPLHAS